MLGDVLTRLELQADHAHRSAVRDLLKAESPWLVARRW
jgi:hypothetical protein